MKTFCIIGWPARYSLSPLIHNGWFRDCHLIDHTYIIKPFSQNESFVQQLDRLLATPHFAGANVTVPYKQDVYRYVKERGSLSPEARAQGVVNTLTPPNNDTPLHGHTTDGMGFLKAIEHISLRSTLSQGGRCVVLGAGGVARSVISALAQENISFCVVNRTPSKADSMLRDLGIVAPVASLEACDGAITGANVFINASSWGALVPSQQESTHMEHMLALLAPNALVMDLLYTPHPTPLTALARRMGLSTEDGCLMLVCQAWYSFRGWMGVSPSIGKALLRIQEHRDLGT